MQFSEAWLRGLVDPALSTAELGHLLTMAGLELEAAEPVAPPFTQVVVAEILSAEKHPDADRLQVCRVRAGEGEPLQIVCGAPNARAGLRTACALVGARLPEFEIKRAKVRGVDSFGMLCSAKELGIDQDAAGIMELPADAPVGTSLRDYLALDDTCFTLKLTPNRGDCLSILGVAREVAAITGASLTEVDCAPVPAELDQPADVGIEAESACPLYLGRILRGINPAARTPGWMTRRLERSGLRAIHPVVDVTNYVLLELGQPMHAFDLAKLDGGVRARMARSGESIELLNGQTVTLDSQSLVIADARGPVALAGIMGGAASAVDASSVDILLEAAHFTPAALAGRARTYGLSSDSSHRFERGVDPSLPARAMERATRLILDICGGKAGEVCRAGPGLAAPQPIRFRPERARRLLGIAMPDDEMEGHFRRLGMGLDKSADAWLVTPPSYRFDLALEVDLVEEVARLEGYDHLPSSSPGGANRMRPAREDMRPEFVIKTAMVSMGYQEIITYSFISREQDLAILPQRQPIALINPIASQLGVMRGSLWAGLLQALRHNLNHGCDRMRAFELGRCFQGVGADQQPLVLAGMAFGNVAPEQWGEPVRQVDFFDVKGDLERLLSPLDLVFSADGERHPALHPGQCARILSGGALVGWLGVLHPRLTQQLALPRAPVLFELDATTVARRNLPHYQGVSRLPAVRRDLAVLVDDAVPVGTILSTVREGLPALVSSFSLFDVYRGSGIPEGKKSLAFSMLLQHTEKTLTDAEIDAGVAQVFDILSSRFSATLRA